MNLSKLLIFIKVTLETHTQKPTNRYKLPPNKHKFSIIKKPSP